MDRRRFGKICAGSAATLVAGIRPVLAEGFQDYPKVKLLDAQGAPLKASALSTEETYIFHYPFNGVPCC